MFPDNNIDLFNVGAPAFGFGDENLKPFFPHQGPLKDEATEPPVINYPPSNSIQTLFHTQKGP